MTHRPRGSCRRGASWAALLCLALAAPVGAQEFQPIPSLRDPVVDRAGVLSEAARGAIRALALEVREKTGAELAVVIVPTTQPEDVFDYAMRVFDSAKLGRKGKDDGLLLVVALQDRRLHMLTGYGLEGILPDGRVGEIRDSYITPAFKRGDYAGGVYAGLRAAAEVIAADAGVELGGAAPAPPQPRARRGTSNLGLLWLLLLAPLLFGRRRRGRVGYAPIFFGGGFGGGGGGGFGGGGFGGGFGGGGFSGGGGAGGSW